LALAALAVLAVSVGRVVTAGASTAVSGRNGAAAARQEAASQQSASVAAAIAAARAARKSNVGIHKIKHVVIIMQENHSFDNYFGTYPGADGIPGLAGNPGNVPCIPDPKRGHCDAPYHETNVTGSGGPHFYSSAISDVDGGKMDGFAETAEQNGAGGLDTDKAGCAAELQPSCLDVMGYYNQEEIPNYWTYAKDFVLQDHMFEPVLSWSEVAHLYMVSGWSAQCSSDSPDSCATDIQFPELPPDLSNALLQEATGAALGIALPLNPVGEFSWTDITYLLHKFGVSWKYYVEEGTEPDCETGAMVCTPVPQAVNAPSIWNPLPNFADVKEDNQLGNIVPSTQLFTDASAGNLPAVSWVIPSGDDSEHAPANIEAGQDHVTNVINAIMRSRDWDSTAIFLAWDDWGGYYDNVIPPKVDAEGYGIRVPGLVISPYAKQGFVDHQTLSFDAYLKFIENDFLDGSRLNPKTDGRPDPRPDVREDAPQLGSLSADFDFNQTPRAPMILNPNPTGMLNLVGPTTLGTTGSNSTTQNPECPRTSGAVVDGKLGPVRIGLTRTRQRKYLPHYQVMTNKHFDDYCLASGQWIRVGYQRSKAVLAMTANAVFKDANVSPGAGLIGALAVLGGHVDGPFKRGSYDWYAKNLAHTTLFIQAHDGVVSEIGIGLPQVASSASEQRHLLNELGA
jgi:phospholipase C